MCAGLSAADRTPPGVGHPPCAPTARYSSCRAQTRGSGPGPFELSHIAENASVLARVRRRRAPSSSGFSATSILWPKSRQPLHHQHRVMAAIDPQGRGAGRALTQVLPQGVRRSGSGATASSPPPRDRPRRGAGTGEWRPCVDIPERRAPSLEAGTDRPAIGGGLRRQDLASPLLAMRPRLSLRTAPWRRP